MHALLKRHQRKQHERKSLKINVRVYRSPGKVVEFHFQKQVRILVTTSLLQWVCVCVYCSGDVWVLGEPGRKDQVIAGARWTENRQDFTEWCYSTASPISRWCFVSLGRAEAEVHRPSESVDGRVRWGEATEWPTDGVDVVAERSRASAHHSAACQPSHRQHPAADSATSCNTPLLYAPCFLYICYHQPVRDALYFMSFVRVSVICVPVHAYVGLR